MDRHAQRTPDAATPIFRTVLGEEWHRLGAIVRRHYALRPFGNDAVTVRGTMHEVWHSGVAKLLLPMARIAGALVPYRGREVPIEVHYSCRPNAAALHWDRVFHFPGRAPFHFRSRMEMSANNEVIEFVRFGIGMRMAVTAEGGALVFHGRGYVWRLFGRTLPLPLGLVLGSAYVEERPVDEERFAMRMALTHRLLGELFRYDGSFTIDAPADVLPAAVPRTA